MFVWIFGLEVVWCQNWGPSATVHIVGRLLVLEHVIVGNRCLSNCGHETLFVCQRGLILVCIGAKHYLFLVFIMKWDLRTCFIKVFENFYFVLLTNLFICGEISQVEDRS